MKVFIERKTRTEKAYAYGELLSFKTSATYKFFYNFTPDIFCRTLSDARCEYSGLQTIGFLTFSGVIEM